MVEWSLFDERTLFTHSASSLTTRQTFDHSTAQIRRPAPPRPAPARPRVRRATAPDPRRPARCDHLDQRPGDAGSIGVSIWCTADRTFSANSCGLRFAFSTGMPP